MTDFKLAPYDSNKVPSGKMIAEKLQSLIGTHFPLTDKPRTNGSNLRKLITKTLDDGSILVANKEDYIIIPLKGKGVPRLLACLCDTYIVTTGESYNLQVWNRLPNSSNVLIRYKEGTNVVRCSDILFVFAKLDPAKQEISSIIVATPQYIVDKFGQFGVPTIKHQMIISDIKRNIISSKEDRCLFFDDTKKLEDYTNPISILKDANIFSTPKPNELLPLKTIKDRIATAVIGSKIEGSDTKTKGQYLERTIASLLGFMTNSSLAGGYPDIPNQLLEVKVQDSPTVDLGKYSPSYPTVINESMNLTTEDVRYIIALTDKNGYVEGLIISPGINLCSEFTIVSGTSYKCQRSIPMSFFNNQKGHSVFNP